MITGSQRRMSNVMMSSKRFLTSHEVSVALRPFFFAVHPDRYVQHPEIRNQNEKSLQIFNGYMNDLFPVSPSLTPIKVSFSIVDKKAANTFRNINIQLSGTDPIKIVKAALESCQLNTSNLKSKSHVSSTNDNSTLNSNGFTTSNINEDLLQTYLRRKKKAAVMNNLQDTLMTQRDEAIKKRKESLNHRISIQEDIMDLKDRTGLKDVVWQMDWAETHMRRCISNFHRFFDQCDQNARDTISRAFYKNVLRFGRGSFTCCDGSIQLGADHVPEQWEKTCLEHQVRRSQIPSLKQSTEQLEESLGGAKVLLPYYKGLAQTLSQIQALIVRIWRKEALLVRIANAGAGSMVEVVTSYDELAIGVDGRLYIPCNVDIPSLVVFLEENAEKAAEINHQMQALINELEFTKNECVQELNLINLTWDNTFSPVALLESINRLKSGGEDVRRILSGLSVHISTNPSIHILTDGTVSIPINWT